MKISFLAKIAILLVAFAGVLYSMQKLNSEDVSKKLMDPDNSLNLLIGGDEKPTNWCPRETVEVALYNDQEAVVKTLTSAIDVSSVCEIMVGSFSNEGVEEKAYSKRLAAKSKAGDIKVLEQIPGKPIFRVQGLPFSSPMLLKNLAERSSP